MNPSQARFYEFGSFRIDTQERLLFRDRALVSLPLKVFETLLFLVRHHGQIVDKSVLTKELWPNTHVGIRSLAQNVFLLRKNLGNQHFQFVETIPKRGYRFIAAVRSIQEDTAQIVDQLNGHPGQRVINGVLAIRQLAVLPFRFLGEERDKEEEYLGVGLADALITRFSSLEQLVVCPTSSILKYVASDKSLLEIGQELEVDSILEGKIQRSGSTVRITLQLVNAYNGAAVWANQFDCDLTDIFALQDAISERIVQSLMLKLSAREKAQMAAHHTENAQAYKDYIKGRFYWNKRTAEELLKGIECFERSLQRDPQYALAYAGLADCYDILCFHGAFAPKEIFPKAIAAATKALELDPHLGEAAASQALASLSFDWNWVEAEQWFKRAFELNPNYPTTYQWYAEYQLVMGHLDEAVVATTRAQELDPLSIALNRHVGWTLCYAREYDLALEQIQSTLDLEPDNAFLYHDLGMVYVHTERTAEAIAALQRANMLSPDDPAPLAFLGYAYAVTGLNNREAQQALDQLQKMSARRFVSPYFFAVVHAGLGEKDLAFRWLDRAFAERSNWMMYLNVEPAFDVLRPDPRFRDLQIKMNLPEIGR